MSPQMWDGKIERHSVWTWRVSKAFALVQVPQNQKTSRPQKLLWNGTALCYKSRNLSVHLSLSKLICTSWGLYPTSPTWNTHLSPMKEHCNQSQASTNIRTMFGKANPNQEAKFKTSLLLGYNLQRKNGKAAPFKMCWWQGHIKLEQSLQALTVNTHSLTH